MTTEEIENLCRWNKEKEVNTKRGVRLLRTSLPDESFWDKWNSPDQAEIKAAGISLHRDLESDQWRVCWWRELPKEVVAEREKRVELSKAIAADIEIPKPDGLDYMAFQTGGIAYCLNAFGNNGVLIGDEPGLGKTIQAIGVINAVEKISKVLVICPMTLKANWERELKKWIVRPMTIGHANSEFFPRTDIVLIHYNILHKFTTRLSNYWDLMVVDECHRLGNAKTRQTKSVVGHKPTRKEAAAGVLPTSGIPAVRKLMLSGTPFENRPAQLWPIVSYIAPTLFSSRSAFEKRYCGAGNNGFGWQADGATNLEELGERLRGCCMIRRLKKDVLKELPAKTRQIVEMETDGFEKVIQREKSVWTQHEDELEEAQAAMELAKASDSEDEFKASVSSLRTKATLIFTEIARVRHETALAKMPKMVEMLKDELAEISKVIVFAHHTDVLRGAASQFAGECVLITGDTPQEERDRLVQRFQNDPKCKVFFGSIRATGEGITLTSASTVIFFENDWTASKMAQCSDRAHRIGQKDNVLVKYYILPGTIDAHMIQTWIRKEEILEKALDSEKAEVAAEPTLIPKAEPISTRRELEIASVAITSAQRNAILSAIKLLSAHCDGARQIDGAGFNKLDAAVGRSLASQHSLTPKQAALAQKICRKYQRQLGADVLAQCGINKQTTP